MKSPSQKPVAAGFTLVEIVIVLTIIAILAGGLMFGVKGFISEGQDVRITQDVHTIGLALDAFQRNNYYRYPTQEQGLSVLVSEPTDPKPQKWYPYLKTKEIPKDPWGREYQYKFPPARGGEDYDLFSLGKDGVESEDDIGNWKK